MSPRIALVAYTLGILGLFLLDRDRNERTSKALWVPVLWVLIAGSRTLSLWFGVASAATVNDTYVNGTPLDRNVFLFLLVIGLIVLIGRGQRVIGLLRANGPILLFFFYCAVSVLWSDYPDIAFKRWIKAVGDIVMIMIVLTDSEPLAALKRLLARCGFVLLPYSILCIKYYSEFGRDYRPDFGVWVASYTGVTTSKNELGMITLLFGLASLWCFLDALQKRDGTRRTGSLFAHGIILAIVIWLFWVINSMTSLSCFLMGTTLILATSIPWLARKRALIHVLVVSMILFSLFAIFIAPSLLGALGRDATLTGRTDIWDQVISLKGNPWVGVGFDSFWLGSRLQKMWSMYWWHPNEAHDGYLEVYLNLGWIGIGLLAIVIVTSYRKIIGAFRFDPVTTNLKLAYFVVALIYNLTETAIREGNLMWIFFLLAVLTVPSARIPESPTLPVFDRAKKLTKPQPEVQEVIRAGFRQETI